MNMNEFTFEEDYVIGMECLDCGMNQDTDEEVDVCEECGSHDVVFFTSHEGCKCERCSHEFDIWEDGYVNDDLVMICDDCYHDLSEQ